MAKEVNEQIFGCLALDLDVVFVRLDKTPSGNYLVYNAVVNGQECELSVLTELSESAFILSEPISLEALMAPAPA